MLEMLAINNIKLNKLELNKKSIIFWTYLNHFFDNTSDFWAKALFVRDSESVG
jgi:hypothetical protein